MARGRTLFSEHRRRAASVPVGDLSFPDSSTTSKLYDIKAHVANDTDALMSASKRHDRDFLHSIQTKLANPTLVSTGLKTPPTLNHNRSRGPPPSRSAFYAASATVPSSTPRDLRRRTWYGPTSNRVDDYEVAAYLATPIRAPFVSRALRAGSVPPVMPSRATAPRWYPSNRGVSVPRWAPSSYQTYGGGKSYLQSHPDMEDIVVGVAPTALYGDIVIGIPYRKQFMFDAQHALDAVDDYPRIPVATRVTSPYFARSSKPSYDSWYEDADVIPYRRATYTGPNYVTRRSYYGYPSTQQQQQYSTHGSTAASAVPSSSVGSRFSTYGYPARASSARLNPSRAEYDLELSTSKTAPKESFSNLRLRASLARDKANEHKSMLDRYMPIDEALNRGSVTTGTSIDFRPIGVTYNPISASGGSSSAAAASAAAAAAGPTSSKPFKPQISETRQRVRNLLCKSKKDPHYFD